MTSGDFNHGAPAWVDDDTLVCSAGRTPTWDTDLAIDLWRFSASGDGDPEQLTSCGGVHAQPSVGPDGTIVLVHGDSRISPTHSQIAVLDGSGDARDLTRSLDRTCASALSGMRTTWDGDAVLFTIDDHGSVPLLRIDPATGEVTRLLEGNVSGASAAAGTVAATIAQPDGFGRLVAIVGGDVRELASYEVPFAVSPAEHFAVGEIDAWLVRPIDAGDGPHPTLLNIHGGPFSQYGHALFDEFQVQAGAGYAVICCNPRGSSGSTEGWGRAIRGPLAQDAPGSGWGTVDMEDILAVVDAAVSRFPDVIDGERIGVLGGSYGGYMTSWLVGHTDRFVAACAERALTNMVTFCHTSDIGARFPASYLGVSHLEAPDEFALRSPVTYADRITTPLLLLHSERDLRCPIEQAEDLYTRLKLLGREVELVRFPGESHELSRSGAPKHRLQRFEIILEFFDRHLKKG